MNKKESKQMALNLYHKGYTVYYIAEAVGKSKSTIYRYIQEEYEEVRYPILKDLIKRALLHGDFKIFIISLSYKDVCLIRRKFNLYGYDKESKIKAILDYFKDFSILGLYPENLNKDKIKRAFRKKAKETHPDLNKNLDKSGKEFQEVYQSYTTLVEIY